TLEHLPKPTAFWRERTSLLEKDGLIFLQVPQYRPEHVVPGHYIFYTEESLTAWAAKSMGAVPIWFGYDATNGFLAMIAQRKVQSDRDDRSRALGLSRNASVRRSTVFKKTLPIPNVPRSFDVPMPGSVR